MTIGVAVSRKAVWCLVLGLIATACGFLGVQQDTGLLAVVPLILTLPALGLGLLARGDVRKAGGAARSAAVAALGLSLTLVGLALMFLQAQT